MSIKEPEHWLDDVDMERFTREFEAATPKPTAGTPGAYEVGAGIWDVTGQIAEIGFMGYAVPGQKGSGLQLRLRSRAFVFVDGNPGSSGARVVYVSIDLCMGFQMVKLGVIERLQAKFGPDLYTHQNVLISGTHTHATPGAAPRYDVAARGLQPRRRYLRIFRHRKEHRHRTRPISWIDSLHFQRNQDNMSAARTVLIPRLASTVLVMARAPASSFSVRGNLFKLLFIQRASSSGFMASAHVFPGGVLDKDDEADAWKQSNAIDSAAVGSSAKPGSYPFRSDKRDSLAMRICALRELFEETGLMLARPTSAAPTAAASSASSPSPLSSSVHSFSSLAEQRAAQKASSASAASLLPLLSSLGLAFEPHKLAPWSRWITPVFEKRRYDTLFYLAALDAPVASLTPDPSEVAETRWLSPVEALDLAARREIVLPPPTTYILRELEFVRTLEEVMAAAPGRDMPALLPRLFPVDAVPWQSNADATLWAPMLHLSLPGDPCYPLDEEGTVPSTANPLSSPQQWHRMVRCADPKVDPVTRIYRPAHLHLTPSPAADDEPASRARAVANSKL